MTIKEFSSIFGEITTTKTLKEGESAVSQPEKEPVAALSEKAAKAAELLMSKKYEESIAEFKKIITQIDTDYPEMEEFKANCEYNVACAYSLVKKSDEAIEFLAMAITDGFVNFEHIKKDTDLDNIRNDIRYKKLIGEK